MEAPEKVYRTTTYPNSERGNTVWKNHPVAGAENVEYIRKDAFIEKACEYFRRGLEDTKVIDDYRNIAVRGIQASYTSVEEFIENFVNYMKGE